MATSAMTMQSTAHARDRRFDRIIPREAAQRAKKYGVAHPNGLADDGTAKTRYEYQGITAIWNGTKVGWCKLIVTNPVLKARLKLK